MDKNAIKKYAVWARRELISRVAQRAALYEITEDGFGDPEAQSAHGRVLTDEEKAQRRALVARIRQEGYQQVMEEVAYTWFNRFIALRFMEVNGYLPSRVRVFTDENNQFKPQILAEAMNLELDGLDPQKVYTFKNANNNDGLFKYMVIVQCNALSAILPRMFQRISDYTELLFPDNLLREGSVVEQMISVIPEDDWRDAVQIIGWLYQYYNAEKKDEVFAALKKNVKITKENIPAATQLFTPDWIVRYMVENSLGRLWVEGHPNDDLKANWKYYLEEAEQEPDVQAQLAEIRKEYAAMKPEDIKCIDPCCGSGHILAYLFDVLVQIYESYGYTTREAVESIVQNNLYGLDIDDRAAQLAYFAVMMKARQYDRRFFSRGLQPNIYAIQESNGIDGYALDYFCNGDTKLKAAMDSIIAEMHDAKEYGSILNITSVDFSALYARFDEVRDDISMSKESVLNSLLPLVQVAHALAQKYDVVVTNPPYMGSSGMSGKLSEFVKKNYPDSKSDFFSVFMERADSFAKKNKFTSLITMESWMFLSSFEKLRERVNQSKTIINMVHMPYLGKGGTSLGINFGTAAVVMKKGYVPDYSAQYEYTVYYECDSEGVPFEFPAKNERWKTAKQSNFSKIPGSPVAYWVSEKTLDTFSEKPLSSYGWTSKGIITGDNAQFLRTWFEVSEYNINFLAEKFEDSLTNDVKWYPCNKGGDFRKWYGNNVHIINWYHNGEEVMQRNVPKVRNCQDYKDEYKFSKSITWTSISSSKSSFRWSNNMLSESAGMTLFIDEKYLYQALGFLNSNVAEYLLLIINPTLNFTAGSIANLPFDIDDAEKINGIVENNIFTSKSDWDAFETSWDFKKHPLL